MRKTLGIIMAGLAALATPALAQMPTFEPAPAQPMPPGTITLMVDGKAPVSKGPEIWFGKGRNTNVRNVSVPTLTPVFPAKGKANGSAVIVAPGGAFMLLAINHEGWPIARWLADHGITAFVLKYRLEPTSTDPAKVGGEMGARMSEVTRLDPVTHEHVRLVADKEAVDDAHTAIALVRSRAKEWGIDPNRIGLMGFSAGAMTTIGVIEHPVSGAQPDFIAPIYPPLQRMDVPADAPPMFAAIASDDGLFARLGIGLIESWQKAKRPVEFHMYERGNHGFGPGMAGTTSTHWMDEFLWWMESRGLTGKPTQSGGTH